MNLRITKIIFIFIIFAALLSCGQPSKDSIILTGNLILDTENPAYVIDSPVFIAVCKTIDYNRIVNQPLDNILELAMVDFYTRNFSIDLTGSDVKAGDKVYLFAFTENGYEGGLPYLSEGNILGFYINEENYDLTYTLRKGNDNYFEITVNRIVFDYEASVNTSIKTEEAGEVTIVAYTGNIDSFNFNNLDIDNVIGYVKTDCSAGTTSCSVNILPFGFNIPITDVYIFAFIDKNGNGKPDSGDKWGTAFSEDDDYPQSIIVSDRYVCNVEISLDHELTSSSGFSYTLQGNLELPAGYGESSPPVFMIVCNADSPDAIFDNKIDSIKYFEKLPAGATSFNLEMPDTDMVPGDQVMIIALWDKDYISGFPRVTQNDVVGYYIDSKNSYQYALNEGSNSGLNIRINKTYRENDAYINGTITSNDPGDVIIVAYSGDINSYNLDLDADKIIGYEKIVMTSLDQTYQIHLFPFTSFPISNVYVFGFLDRNSNGKPDAGDRWGCFSGSDGYPQTISVNNSYSIIENNDFILKNEISTSTSYSISLQGSITPPAGYSSSSKPVYIVVCDSDDPDSILNDSMNSVKYFEKLPAGATTFNLDLSGTGLAPGDEVMIIALWDLDYVSGFPKLSEGDMIGYYINEDTYSYDYTLTQGPNTGLSINLNKTYKTNIATVSGNILGTDSGDVILIAYAGEFNSLDANIDVDKVLAYMKVAKGGSPLAYSMNLLPFTSSFPVSNVYMFAVLDLNNNGTPDNGDKIGFYTNNTNKIPTLVTLQNSSNTGLDIEFLMYYVEPTTGGTQMTLSGSITAPNGYSSDINSKPIFIIIAQADTTFDMMNSPMSSIKYFTKLPQGNTAYNIDLTNTGLQPGDEIRILALWDKNYTAGFPNPDNGDKIGYYQNKSSFSFSKVINAGNNTASLSGGWSFGINKTIYLNDASFTFRIEQKAGSLQNYSDLNNSDIIGKDLILVMVYRDGVDTSDYSITDMDYIISIDYVKNVTTLPVSYTLSMFPFIYDSIPKGSSPLSVNGIYLYAILDSNSNMNPDSGENVGYYWTYIDLLTGLKIPKLYTTPIYYDRDNRLNGEVVSIFTRTY